MRRLTTVSVLMLAIAAPETTWAEEIPRGETVTSRPKPELDPLGIKVGQSKFLPKVVLSGHRDDNIRSAETDTESDFITTLEAGGRLETNWQSHAIRGGAKVESAWYSDSSGEDYVDITLDGSGRFDFKGGGNMSAGFSAELGHEDRSSPDDADGLEPTDYNTFKFDGDARRTINKTALSTGFVVTVHDVYDTQTSTTTVNNDDRDRVESTANVRGGYRFNPQSEWFAKAEINTREYHDDLDDSGYNRDSHGVDFTTGLSFSLTGITFGDVFLGYREQTYDDAQLVPISGFSGGLDMTWNASTITTVKASVKKTVEETTSTGASGIFKTTGTLSIDHELLRNMIINANASYADDAYEGIDRKDTNTRLGLGVDYKMFRNLYWKLSYDYAGRSSDAAGSDYTKNTFLISMTSRL